VVLRAFALGLVLGRDTNPDADGFIALKAPEKRSFLPGQSDQHEDRDAYALP